MTCVMILSYTNRSYFEFLQAKVSQAMARTSSKVPYFMDDDPVIANYEVIRDVWFHGSPIKRVCQQQGISRSQYYKIEDQFVKHGLPGLFPNIRSLSHSEGLERLVIMVSKARSSLSQQAILRIAQVVTVTQEDADIDAVSQILNSYGRSIKNRPADVPFWSRIQRTLNQLSRLKKRIIKGRDKKHRKATFFVDEDSCHKRMELLREIFLDLCG